MARVVWTSPAMHSLKDIWIFFAEKDISLANKISSSIIEAALSIVFIEQYQIEESLGKPYRRIISGNYKIIYTRDKNIIYIITVFDTRQDPNKLSIK